MGWDLAPWQRDSLTLETRQTVLISPRQCGKSRSLSVLATWWAFKRPGQLVLVVSAGDEAAGRLLRSMRQITDHPLLAGSVVDETQHRVILSNGSEIRSVPASERQVRGWSVDLLLVDEAAFVSEDLLVSAALPTTAARPDARTVLASTPWADSGPFWKFANAGLEEGNPYTRTHRWKLADAWWISPEAIESARTSMSPLQFRAEYEGEFVGAADAYFPMDDLLAAVADFPMQRDGGGAPAFAGLDWGRQQDAHAIALLGQLDDFGMSGRAITVVPWIETSRRPYGAQLAEIEAVAAGWDLTILSEVNGVGAAPTETLAERVPRARVRPRSSTQASKEDCYGRLALLLAERAIVLPNHVTLLRQLGGVAATPTPSGGLRIAARTESLHDDMPDALSLAAGALPRQLTAVPLRDVPEAVQWTETAGGIRVPVPVQTISAEASYLATWGELVQCAGCSRHYLTTYASCTWCRRKGTHEVPSAPGPDLAPAAVPAATGAKSEAVPITARGWASSYLPENPRRCLRAGHYFAGVHGDDCPQCRGGGGRRTTLPGPLGRAG